MIGSALPVIRPLTAADRDVYLELSDAFYHSSAVLHPVPASYREATFREMLRSDTYARGFLLESAGQAAGYALLACTFSQEAGGQVVWVEELFVRPAFRGQGIATAFFRYLRKTLPAARYRLEVEPDNEGAARLYRRCGFTDLPYRQMVLETPEK